MQGIRYIFQVAHRADAKDKPDAFIIPSVQISGLTEISIATHKNFSKARRKTQVHGLIKIVGSPGAAGAIAAAIDQV